jgi:hypothetical protein
MRQNDGRNARNSIRGLYRQSNFGHPIQETGKQRSVASDLFAFVPTDFVPWLSVGTFASLLPVN